jgi:hypothetical protein
MQFQFGVSSMAPPTPAAPPAASTTEDLLRQILEVQREQLDQMRALATTQREHIEHMRAAAAANDPNARWRAVMERWEKELPGFSEACRTILPTIERAYWGLKNTLVQQVAEEGEDSLDNEFAVQEFLDRYALRLMHLGYILNSLAPLVEATTPKESSGS